MLNRTRYRALLVGLSCLAAVCLPLRAQELKSIPPGSLNGALPPPANGVPVPLDPPVLPSPSISNAPTPATPWRAVPPAVPPAPAETEAALDPLERNDFQELIAQTLGQRLPLFGYSLFARPPSTFAPVDNIPVTPDYLIGPGDELLIRAWGQIDVDYRAVVDRNGTISIPQIGVLPVASVRYADLTGHVRTAVGRNFHNFKLMVTLGQLRSVQVFVVGHARRPGVYTVSSLSTLVNAIFAAGGPSASGSMRAIELKRGGATVTRFDLYELLLKGDKSKDMALLPGDVIYFPPLGALAAVAGAVRKPGIYELNGAASAATLLQYAGGLSTTAQTRLAAIERIDNRRSRSADSFELDAQGLARGIKDGDLLNVLHISPKFENSVTLRGQVAQPLRHPYRKGMRVSDLIPERDALVTADYHLRKNSAVRVEALQQGQLASNVRQLGEEINWDYAVIERQHGGDLSTALIPFNLGKAVLEGDIAHDLPLLPGDVVTVFSKGDVAAPVERRSVVVRLEGEFNSAGVYQARPGETLRQLVVRVGGVTKKAHLFAAEFNRDSTRRSQEERLRQTVHQLEQDMHRASFTRAQNVVSMEDSASLKQEAEAQRALVARLKTVKPSGRIVLDLPPDAELADLPDLPLEDGDRFYVPQAPSMVSVVGTVYNESSYIFRPGRTVADYLAQAGGPRKEADRDGVYLIRADGSVISRKQAGFLVSSLGSQRVMPGDTIVVPEDFQRTTWSKDLKDWTQILYQFGLGAAALTVIGN